MPYIQKVDSFASMARELAKLSTLSDTLQAIVGYATRTIEGAEHAAITVKRGEQRYQTVAATGDLPLRVDAIQYDTLQGPCLQALEEHHVFRSDDLATDGRWPLFGPRAVEATEVLSMMSHRLYLEEQDVIGALNLYSRKPAAFAELQLSVLDDLATHCAIALTTAAEREQNQHLRTALESNRDIGVAIGILMGTKLLTKQQAFDALRIASQHSHRKLRDVATEVIETGELPKIGLLAAGHS